MKSFNKIIIPLLLLVALAGCDNGFLDRPSLDKISANNFYQTTTEIRLATSNLYGPIWGQWNAQILSLGDVISGNGTTGTYQGSDNNELFAVNLSASNGIANQQWTGLYNVIGQCNNTILGIQQYAPATVTTSDKNAAIAEARFIRGVAYFYLTMLWGPVPIVEDNSKLIAQPLLNRIITKDVYKFVTNDLTFAAQNLPLTDVKGRVTTWSAQGMLSKVYLTQAGLDGNGTRNQALLDSAKLYASNVCKNSGIALHPSYYDLFKVQFNDVPEDLFALQWAAGAEYNMGNFLNNYAPSAEIMPYKIGAWGAIHPTTGFFSLYSAKDSIRRKATIMLNGDLFPELNTAGGGFKANGVSLKKHIIGNQVDNSSPLMSWFSSPEHNAILRLADVYLIYAEAIMGSNTSTSDPEALLYFNKVRTRAGVDPLTTITLDALLNERRIELAFEGQYWMDLVRLSYWNQDKALAIINSQNRTFFSYTPATSTTPAVVTADDSPVLTVLPATPSSFQIQIPARELTSNPKLADPAVAYFK